MKTFYVHAFDRKGNHSHYTITARREHAARIAITLHASFHWGRGARILNTSARIVNPAYHTHRESVAELHSTGETWRG